MSQTIYTGIGSRETPQNVINLFIGLGRYFAKQGFILRSGGADGADSAFELGCSQEKGLKEIYLPWKNFNNNDSELYQIPEKAFDIVSNIHPAFNKLSQGAQKLHARNCQQVLGKNLDTPTNLVLCYTKNGEIKGGTATAINLANSLNIPVFNFGLLFG